VHVSEYVTRHEAAQIVGVNVRTIDSYIKRGLLVTYHRKGMNTIRLRRSDLEEFLTWHPKARTRGPILSL
jgi:excisionase family DNA binding protein